MIVRRHLIPALAFAIITCFWLAPLLSRLSTALAGPAAGDNATFVWNLWWMRYALQHRQSFFQTTLLFHPIGADLTLHTHTALPALVAAIVGPSSVIAAQNLLIAADLYLNFVCCYALAFRATRQPVPSFLAAVIFGTSAFVSAHLWGHFNLIAVWTLPLTLLLAEQARERRTVGRAVVAGGCLGAIAYIDYYLFVYAAILIALCWVSHSITVSATPIGPSRRRRLALATTGVLLVLDLAVITAISAARSNSIDLGPWHISIRSVSNPITAGWLLIVLAAALIAGPRFRIRAAPPEARDWRVMAATGITSMAILVPLIVRAVRLFSQGLYVSQPYQWRSAPAGVDAASIILGNPFHLLWGERIRRLYHAVHIDPIEGSAWMPVGALVLAAVALTAFGKDRRVRQTALVLLVFGTWALGPWLVAFGSRTPLVLPAIAIRYIPIVANARIPGRAIAVVYLAVAMLAAIGLASLLARAGRARLCGWSLAIGLVLESLPAPPPTFRPHIPAQYAALRDDPARGAVCELPLGVRDGFGETGQFDSAVLLHQTVHERPIVGGFLARLPQTVVREYAAMPVMGSLLRLSAGAPLSGERAVLTPDQAASALASEGIAFVVLDTDRASPDLVEYVRSRIALERITQEDGKIFYRVVRQAATR